MNTSVFHVFFLLACLSISSILQAQGYVYEAGHESLKKWLLPEHPPFQKDNFPSSDRVALGKKLFFDPRISGDGTMSCASCHNPLLGWSDGLPTGAGFKGKVLGRASPTIINSAYNFLQMWDGRAKNLEEQATGPLEADVEMNADLTEVVAFLKSNEGYSALFTRAYKGEGINKVTLSKAIASFERTVVSRNSRFDQWVRGDLKAMSKQEIDGFKFFTDSNKGNCEVCHGAPNFTDNGFHNIGLKQFATSSSDAGRHALRPLNLMKGAFKTPTLRDINLTAPYFHDGSAKDLHAVMAHYELGGEVKTNLSPSMKPLKLSKKERKAIIAFLNTLTTNHEEFTLPALPLH